MVLLHTQPPTHLLMLLPECSCQHLTTPSRPWLTTLALAAGQATDRMPEVASWALMLSAARLLPRSHSLSSPSPSLCAVCRATQPVGGCGHRGRWSQAGAFGITQPHSCRSCCSPCCERLAVGQEGHALHGGSVPAQHKERLGRRGGWR